MNEIFKEYADLQKQIDALEERKVGLRESIASSLPETGEKNEFGNFFWKTKKKYKYSDNVTAMETSLKETKKQEEEAGIAQAVESRELNIKLNN